MEEVDKIREEIASDIQQSEILKRSEEAFTVLPVCKIFSRIIIHIFRKLNPFIFFSSELT